MLTEEASLALMGIADEFAAYEARAAENGVRRAVLHAALVKAWRLGAAERTEPPRTAHCEACLALSHMRGCRCACEVCVDQRRESPQTVREDDPHVAFLVMENELMQDQHAAYLQRVHDVASELIANVRCVCHECWTERGRHDPKGCTWEDISELRAAVESSSEPKESK